MGRRRGRRGSDAAALTFMAAVAAVVAPEVAEIAERHAVDRKPGRPEFAITASITAVRARPSGPGPTGVAWVTTLPVPSPETIRIMTVRGSGQVNSATTGTPNLRVARKARHVRFSFARHLGVPCPGGQLRVHPRPLPVPGRCRGGAAGRRHRRPGRHPPRWLPECPGWCSTDWSWPPSKADRAPDAGSSAASWPWPSGWSPPSSARSR